MFGLYRMRCGSTIVESSYDYDTQTIGPYVLPLNLPYIPESCSQGDVFYKYKYYTALLKDDEALAVFNLNNYCLVVVRRYQVYETVLDDESKLELLQWSFTKPLAPIVYSHIGYEKSYHNCLAVSQYPNQLVRAANERNAYGYTDAIEGVPLLDPPLSLYKELLNSEAKAVYFDTVSKQPKFLFK